MRAPAGMPLTQGPQPLQHLPADRPAPHTHLRAAHGFSESSNEADVAAVNSSTCLVSCMAAWTRHHEQLWTRLDAVADMVWKCRDGEAGLQ